MGHAGPAGGRGVQARRAGQPRALRTRENASHSATKRGGLGYLLYFQGPVLVPTRTCSASWVLPELLPTSGLQEL